MFGWKLDLYLASLLGGFKGFLSTPVAPFTNMD